MNSFHSELVRLGIVKPDLERRSERTTSRERKPKWRYHSCKELTTVQEAEAHNFQYGSAETTSIIYPSKECSSARLLVPHFECDTRDHWKTTVIPIIFCPFCGERLKE